MKGPQILQKIKCDDFQTLSEVVVDENNNDFGDWHNFRLYYDSKIDRLVVKVEHTNTYINPRTLSMEKPFRVNY